MPEGKEPPKDWEKWQPGSGEYANWPLIAISTDPKADADRLIRGFLPLAFRRPVAEDLASHYVSLVHGRIDKGESFDEAMRAGYKAILCSPHFLTFIEPPGRLDDHAIAARLARFLWSSTPDEQLLAAAAKGSLQGVSHWHVQANARAAVQQLPQHGGLQAGQPQARQAAAAHAQQRGAQGGRRLLPRQLPSS
jgi:hypothetical protein